MNQTSFRGNRNWVSPLRLLIALVFLVAGTRYAFADDAAGKSSVAHEFSFKPDAGTTPKAVNLAGDFNTWSTSSTPMFKGDDGVYRLTLKLAPGKHVYKFVLDGTKWVNDPAADKSLEEDDGQQGKNSAVLISANDPPPTPLVEQAFTYHPENSAVKTVSVAGDFNDWSTDAAPMTAGKDGVFTVKLKLKPATYHYKFVVDGQKWLPDPTADKSLDQDDQHGGMNSGVVVK